MKIVWVTDYPNNATSGYATISKPICNALCEDGHEVKMFAFSNHGEEHWEKFSIIPINDLVELRAVLHNITIIWKPDVIVLAMDIPNLETFSKEMIERNTYKLIGITPMENGPLVQSWAMSLSTFDHVFFISELGEIESRKAGLNNVSHIQIGIDTNLWSTPTLEERAIARKTLGFSETDKIVLTVADNQERKNLWASMVIMKGVMDEIEDAKYVLVTREDAPWGWKLQELANDLGIMNNLILFERGMPQQQLRLLYVCADAFLLTSKAEGLGLPVLEAMAVGLPCVTTDTGALTELINGGGGILVDPAYEFIDVWGNSKRSMIDTEQGVDAVIAALSYEFPYMKSVEYAKSRSWQVAINTFKNEVFK